MSDFVETLIELAFELVTEIFGLAGFLFCILVVFVVLGIMYIM